MKTLKKIIGTVLIVVCLLGGTAVFGGCAKKQLAVGDEVILANFEQWAPDFQILRVAKGFGAVTPNEDIRYVHGGKASAKLQPMGGYSQPTIPYLYFPLYSERFDYNHCNILQIDYVSMYLFNAQADERSVTVGLIASVIDIETVSMTGGKQFVLQPGWNEISYFPDPTLVNLAYDVKDVLGVYLEFANAGVREVSQAPIYYLDDVALYKNKKTDAVKDVVTLDEGEICDFEKAYQSFVISSEVTNASTTPDISVVRAADEGIEAAHGNKVLKVVTKPGSMKEASWPQIVLPEKLMRASGMMQVPEDKLGDYVFRFDVYVVDRPILFVVKHYSFGGGNYQPRNLANSTVGNQLLAVGKWVTYECGFNVLGKNITTNPGFLKIAWGEYVEDEELTFYFDNFRFEKKVSTEA